MRTNIAGLVRAGVGVNGALVREASTLATLELRNQWFRSVSELSDCTKPNQRCAKRRGVELMAQPATASRSDPNWLKHWDVVGTVAWIESEHFGRVTLQFPDELLAESTLVAAAVQHECASRNISAQVRAVNCSYSTRSGSPERTATSAGFSAG